MIHIFNRRKLITTLSDRQLYSVQSALDSANIPYYIKFITSSGRYHGSSFINSDAAHPTVIYVKASDYDRARLAVQAAL